MYSSKHSLLIRLHIAPDSIANQERGIAFSCNPSKGLVNNAQFADRGCNGTQNPHIGERVKQGRPETNERNLRRVQHHLLKGLHKDDSTRSSVYYGVSAKIVIRGWVVEDVMVSVVRRTHNHVDEILVRDDTSTRQDIGSTNSEVSNSPFGKFLYTYLILFSSSSSIALLPSLRSMRLI